ncbi:MAG TPA: PspC domain-containing protein [Acidimicrobiia bacterium]|nr:PspC domain-containing protein [Acidimicrobiia bacterium]
MSNGRQLRRSKDNRMIAGVASGVAEFFDIDVTVVRVVWALTIIFGGFGLLAYVIMWIVVPEEGSDRTVANDIVESVSKKDEPAEEPADEE